MQRKLLVQRKQQTSLDAGIGTQKQIALLPQLSDCQNRLGRFFRLVSLEMNQRKTKEPSQCLYGIPALWPLSSANEDCVWWNIFPFPS